MTAVGSSKATTSADMRNGSSALSRADSQNRPSASTPWSGSAHGDGRYVTSGVNISASAPTPGVRQASWYVAIHSSARRRSTTRHSYPGRTGLTGTLRPMAGTRARTPASVARARMAGLGLWRPAASDPRGVVERLVAMQAQEHAYARWSVGQRCNAPASVVDAAFDA